MFTDAHLHPLSFSQFSHWLHPMIFTNVHRCFTYWMVSKSCTKRMLEHYITILNHYYPLHFLGTSSCPTQLLRFFNLLSRPKKIKAHHQMGINCRVKSPKPTSKWGSDDLPLLAPIHALVDVAEKVHLKGLRGSEPRTKP